MSMRSEIGEQPASLQRGLSANKASVLAIAKGISEIEFNHVFVAARGTSDNAARYAKYLWGSVNRLPVTLAAPSLFTAYNTPTELDGALVVGISQSGASPDLVAVLAEARRQGRPTLAITNEVESPMAREAQWVLDINAGEELAVAATKTYTSSLLAIAMISDSLAGNAGSDALAAVPAQVEAVIRVEDQIAEVAGQLSDMKSCAVIGRGFNHSTAFEWALKIQEVAYTLAHPYSSADFRHGPIAVAEDEFPVLAVAPEGPLLDDIVELMEGLTTGRGAKTVVMSDSERALAAARFAIRLPTGTPEWLSPITSIVAAQLFTYHLGVSRGLDTDAPRGLSKVTLTT